MGKINQALTEDPLLLGAERVPMVLLMVLSALIVVIDLDFEAIEVVWAGAFFGWGAWVLRSAAAYDPRLFAILVVKLREAVPYILRQPGQSRGLWSRPAAPRLMKRLPSSPHKTGETYKASEVRDA